MGMLADMVALSHLVDTDWGEGRDILVAAYELGYARAVVVVAERS